VYILISKPFPDPRTSAAGPDSTQKGTGALETPTKNWTRSRGKS